MTAFTTCDPDQETIKRAGSGDHLAFTRLVELYQSPIYNLCYRLLGNPGEAEEAAQEAFLRAYTRMSSYNPERAFKTWLFSIAHHYCIDRLRRRRLIWISLDGEPGLDEVAWPSSAPTPEETAMRRERSDEVQVMLASLPAQYRSAVVMRYWYDLSYEEIAEATGSTVSAVKSRLHRARGVLAGMSNTTERRPHGSPSFSPVASALPVM